MVVTLLDYGMGNLRSVQRALEAAGAVVRRDTRPGDGPVVLPGVGAFAEAARRLGASGAWDAVAATLAAERPVLGICLGMQLLFERSEEHGLTDGFGVFPGRVEALGPRAAGQTVPNMGWHRLEGLGDPYAYFAHSYGVADSAAAVAWITHGARWVAAARRGPVLGYQFHPEKSGAAGIDLLREWLRW